jgi:hypothetical protein
MRFVVFAVLTTCFLGLSARADEGPFEVVPPGWKCETAGNIHYWSGNCRDAVTGITVGFLVGSPEDFELPCRDEAFATETRGSFNGLDYCETDMTDAASYSVARLLSEAPDLLEEFADWPDPDESFYRVDFWGFDTRWSFDTTVRSECERSRVRQLLLSEGKISIRSECVLADAAPNS